VLPNGTDQRGKVGQTHASTRLHYVLGRQHLFPEEHLRHEESKVDPAALRSPQARLVIGFTEPLTTNETCTRCSRGSR
jgi:Glutamine amidotransferases class-II